MFRRRTDQVYATLQQVQRRITEATPGSGTPNLEAKAPLQPTFAPLHEALPAQRQLAQQQTEAAALAPPQPAPRGRGMYLSGQFAVTLIVLWIASCVLCFVLGQHERERRAPAAAAAFAAGDAGHRDAPADPPKTAIKPLGEHLLVLTSENAFTPELERMYRDRADQLNDIMNKNASRGWKPYFGVRRPTSGGLQLVFGEVAEGVYGVNKKDFEDFARLMAQPKGGGYASAKWVPLN
jgi:hypothetical protein